MKSCVVDAGHVAGSRWLMFLRAKGERVYVNTGVRSPGVVLPWLNLVKVGSFTLRESVLAVKLELSGNNWIFSPAVHVKRSLGKNEGSSIRNTGSVKCARSINTSPLLIGGNSSVVCFGHSSLKLVAGNEVSIINVGSECLDRVRKSINSVGVVERLCAKSLEEGRTRDGGSTVINVAVRLNNPD